MTRIATWYALACLLSWSVAGIFLLAGGEWGSPLSIPVGIAYMFGPLGATFLVRRSWRAVVDRDGLRPRFSRALLWPWLIPVGLSVLTLGVGLLLPGVELSPGMDGMVERFGDALTPEQLEEMRAQAEALPVHPWFLALVSALTMGPTVNMLAAMGEELGWRGFLHGELRGLGFWRSSLLIGVLWGLWHAPLIVQGHNYPDHPVAGVGMMVLFCVGWSPLLSWMRERAGTVWAAALGHGAINASAGLSIMVLAGGTDLSVGMTGAAGLATLALANGVLAWARR